MTAPSRPTSAQAALPALSSIPLMRADVMVQEHPEGARLLRDDVEYNVSGPPAATLGPALAAFDGVRDIETIASEKKLDTEVLRAIFAGLAESGLAVDVAGHEQRLISGDEFLEACRHLF